MAILLRNWHLKLGAIFLAAILYTGLVYSGSFTEPTIPGVQVTAINQPVDPETILISTLPLVEVRYRVVREAAAAITPDAFSATVDLADYDLDRAAQSQQLPITVRSLLEGVTVLDIQPRTATVRLDEVATREIPVRVETGEVPDGLEARTPRVEPDEVQVRGPASVIRQVDSALARVRIDPSGINCCQGPIALLAVDFQGRIVSGPIELNPASVSVQIDVLTVETNKTVAVRPDISGTPAPGFGIGEVGVEPQVATLRGDPDVLRGITEVRTDQLSAAGASRDLTFDAGLVLPAGTRLVEPESQTVAVSVAIEPLVSSRTFVTGLVCQGAPAGWACLPAVDQVSVTVSGPTATLNALGADDVTPVLNVTGRAAGTHNVIPTVSLPGGVSLLAISPGTVSVTLVAPSPSPSP